MIEINKPKLITQAMKDRVGKIKLEEGIVFQTFNTAADVRITNDDSRRDGSVRIAIEGHWVFSSDAAELSVYFKRLAKKLAKREAKAE